MVAKNEIPFYLFYNLNNKYSGYTYGFSNNRFHSLKSNILKCQFCNYYILLEDNKDNIEFRFYPDFNAAYLYLNCCGKKYNDKDIVGCNNCGIVKFNVNTLLEDFVIYSKKVMML